MLESLDLQIKCASENITDAAKKDSMAKLLVTIPGIGCYSALLISSEIGDINRFYNKLAKKKGTAKTTVAAASKLLRVIHCMLKEEREYRKNYS